MNILVTGASGFIGRSLVPALFGDGHAVHALVRARSAFLRPHPDLHLAYQDLASPLDEAAVGPAIDVIVHLAQGNVELPEQAVHLTRVNIQSTVDLLEVGRKRKIRRFILASTGDVYEPKAGILEEDDPVGPVSLYGKSKLCAELMCTGFSRFFEVSILRLFHPYGPGQTGRLIPKLAAQIRGKNPIILHKNQRPRVSPIYIDDVVRVFRRAILSSYSGVVNVSGDTAVTIQELSMELGNLLRCKPAFEESGEETGDLMGKNDRMKQAFSISAMVGLVEGLSRTFAVSLDT